MTQMTVPGFVGGKEIEGAEEFVDLDPSTGEPLARVARPGAAEVDLAGTAAREAFEATVRRQSAEARSGLLYRLAELIRRDADRLALLESHDVGKPLRQAQIDAAVTARYFEFNAGILRAVHGDTLPPADGQVAFTLREPHGVTAHITPWNYPMRTVGRTVAPALAAGHCCVLKPAEDSPVTAVEIAGWRRRPASPTACSTSSRAWGPRRARRSPRIPASTTSPSPARGRWARPSPPPRRPTSCRRCWSSAAMVTSRPTPISSRVSNGDTVNTPTSR